MQNGPNERKGGNSNEIQADFSKKISVLPTGHYGYELKEAANRGDAVWVKTLLEFYIGSFSYTDLLISFLNAFENKRHEVVEIMLQNAEVGKSISSKNNDALLNAAETNNFALVNCLLQFLAVRDNAAACNNWVLFWAIAHGNTDAVNRLLEIQAIEAAFVAFPGQALILAAQLGQIDILKRLLEFPAALAALALYNNEAIHKAVSHGQLAVVQYLLEFKVVHESLGPKINTTLLSIAAERGDFPMVECLLKLPGLQAAVANFNNLPLVNASRNGRLKVVNRLLEFPKVRDALAANNLAFYLAAYFKHFEVVQRLVQIGGDHYCEILKKDYPDLYVRIVDERHSINRLASLLKGPCASDKKALLPKDVQLKILSFAYHEVACGREHPLVVYKCAEGEEGCNEVQKFITDASNTAQRVRAKGQKR